jgi:biotin carboxyl carrier protein
MSTYVVEIQGKEYTLSLVDGEIKMGGQTVAGPIKSAGPGVFSVLLGENSIRVLSLENDGRYDVLCDGIPVEVSVETERSRLLEKYATASRKTARVDELRAPMPALVVRVEVKKGEDVVAGQGLVVLEAMKMENELKATHPGRVKDIKVEKGKAVEKGELLLVLE